MALALCPTPARGARAVVPARLRPRLLQLGVCNAVSIAHVEAIIASASVPARCTGAGVLHITARPSKAPLTDAHAIRASAVGPAADSVATVGVDTLSGHTGGLLAAVDGDWVRAWVGRDDAAFATVASVAYAGAFQADAVLAVGGVLARPEYTDWKQT